MSSSEINPEFEALLEYINTHRGFDFSGYKRSSLMRRVRRRMQILGLENYVDYLDFLEVHPDEFIQLFNTILINVTSFFRDRSTWDYIQTEIIPRILINKNLGQPIRFWSAGCASGEEAYTLAMVICEAIGIEQFRDRVKIYATDIDEEALNQARQATYSSKEVVNIPTHLLDKYFERNDQGFIFHKDLRRSVIFGRHNLHEDAPISRIDLLSCRNAMMYFNAEAQAKILSRFHFALNDGGFLCLGKAEMLLSHSSTFTPVDLKRRIFVKVPRSNLREQLLMGGFGNNESRTNYTANQVRIREVALDASPLAQIVLDFNSLIIMINERARNLFNLSARDVGRPIQDLEISYRPIEMRSSIEQAYVERRTISHRDVVWTTPEGATNYLDIQLTPLLDVSSTILGISITFTDVSRYKQLQQELEHSNQELEMAYEELQSTNEELETTNEELQSTVEELETTNEELQSTNEEMETMNEELQSTNEELQTINDELRRRSEELNKVNDFLASILTSLRGAVVVLDRDLHINVWNQKAEDLWGLRAEEVENLHFLNLDIGLPVDRLRQTIRACLAREFDYQEIVLEAFNRRGRQIECHITVTPLISPGREIQGVILMMEEKVNS